MLRKTDGRINGRRLTLQEQISIISLREQSLDTGTEK